MGFPVWSYVMCFSMPAALGFQRIPLTLRRPANRGALQRRSIAIATDGTSCSATKSRRDGICRLSLSSADEDGVSALKSVVAGLVTAAFVLVGEAGPSLAVDPPDVWPPKVVVAAASAAEAESAAAGLAIATEPTAKLAGELGAVFRKAQDAGSVQQFDKALKLYNQVIKYAPGYVYGWSNRANVLIAQGDLNGAISDYNKALELSDGLSMPDKWIIFLNRGTTFLALGENDFALEDLNQAVKLNKQKDLYALANRAQALERREEWSKALIDYEGAINVQPGNVQPWWIRYGLVLFQEGRDFDSVACLQRLQSKFEDVGEIHAALTAVQFGRGQTRQAENEWSAIDKVDQDIFLKESYTKDKLKWPPRAIQSLQSFDRLVIREQL